MKTRTLLFSFIAVMLLFQSVTQAQTPVFSWGKVNYGGLDDLANAIAVDVNGNVIEAGFTKSYPGLDFTLQGDTIVQSPEAPGYVYGMSSYAYGDSYIAKYDSTGTLLWYERTTGGFSESVFSVVTDVQGNIILAGLMRSSDGALGTYSMADPGQPAGLSRGFVAKLTPSGSVIWHRFFNGFQTTGPAATRDGITRIENVELDSLGNIYLAASFKADSITCGPLYLKAKDSSPGVPSECVILKLSPSGTPLWMTGIQGNDSESISRIGVDNVGNVYVSGVTFSDTVYVGNVPYPTGVEYNYSFTTKINTSGVPVWFDFNSFYTNNLNNILSVTETLPDAFGNVYLIGGVAINNNSFLTETVTFGSTVITIPYISSQDSLRGAILMVAKYNAAGQQMWLATGSDLYNRAISIVAGKIDANGCLNLVGAYVEPTEIIAGQPLTNNNYTGPSSFFQLPAKGFLARINDQGTFLWTRSIANTFRLLPTDMAADNSGNFYFSAEMIQDSIVFDTTLITGYPIVGGFTDAVIGKFFGNTVNCYLSAATLPEQHLFPMRVFPNPAQDVLVIMLPEHIGQADLKIYNSLGALVYAGEYANGSPLDIAGFTSGIFFVEASFEVSKGFSRFIRQ